jgi:CheY-like chemotaxis protein
MTLPSQILIVEDEHLVALALAHRLRQLGYAIAGLATSGTEAIMQALAHHPDLVLMDLRLPGAVDGLEAAQFLRTHLNMPVLVVTGATDATTLARARQVSPMGVLAKPVADHALQSALEAVLTRRPQGDPSPVAHDPVEREMADDGGPRARLTPTILIVEDDASVQSALAEALRLEAYPFLIVATVQEAEEALQRVGVAMIPLVIADIHLSTRVQAYAGYTLYEHWHRRYPQLPFLLISGSPDSRSLPAVRAGAVRFLAKPFALGDLLQAVREALRAGTGLFVGGGEAGR